MNDTVLLNISEGVAVVTLNRPERRNAMTAPMMERLGEVLQQIRDDSSVRAVVVAGNGKSFCAGADITTLSDLTSQAGGSGHLGTVAGIELLYAAFMAIGELDVPTIAAIHGAAVGGGLGVALQCDIRVIADEAKIGANFSRLGIHSGMCITDLLPAAVGYEAACELLFTGKLIRGTEAAAIGLCRKSVPREQVLHAAMEIAREIATYASPLAVKAIKRTLKMRTTQWREPVLRAEAFAQAALMGTADAQEGIRAVFTKQVPDFKGK